MSTRPFQLEAFSKAAVAAGSSPVIGFLIKQPIAYRLPQVSHGDNHPNSFHHGCGSNCRMPSSSAISAGGSLAVVVSIPRN